MNNSCRFLLVILVLVGSLEMFNFCGADPTNGFTLVPLTESNFELQKPYDIPLDQRYSFVNGFTIYGSMLMTSRTTPIGLDYSSGVWQFEGYGFVPNGTYGATVGQIHGAAHGATTLILRIYDGDMKY
ncbi:citrate-binding protein [Quercus suber]|uniref:Citrate-binding protein n=1 Tax=Quercus suber TaxID=58331 RepID=A0AAW0KPD4_QUESU